MARAWLVRTASVQALRDRKRFRANKSALNDHYRRWATMHSVASHTVCDIAAIRIQRRFLQFIFERGAVSRVRVISRLKIEMSIRHSLLALFVSFILFMALSVVLFESDIPQSKMNIKKSLDRTFNLETLADIREVSELRDYLKQVAAQSLTLQPSSSVYFKDEESQARLPCPASQTFLVLSLSPHAVLHSLASPPPTCRPVLPTCAQSQILLHAGHADNTRTVKIRARARITTGFTLLAWVQHSDTDSQSLPLLRRPLGTTQSTDTLSCWGWFVGATPSFRFGAHDFGGSNREMREEVVVAPLEPFLSPLDT